MRYLKKDKRLWKIQALAGLQSRPPHTASLITFSMESRRSWLIRSRVILPVFSRDKEVRTAIDAFAFPDPSRLRTVFAVRSRYTENQLSGAIKRGISHISSSVLGWTPSRIDGLT